MGRVPHAHWHTTTFVGALRADAILAPLVLDGAINGQAFRAWVEQFLAPELRAGDVVVMDNLGAHRPKRVREIIEGRGCELLYLPPYSPDYNPIEEAFSKLKNLLRRAASRSKDALLAAMGSALSAITAADAQGFFDNVTTGPPGTFALHKARRGVGDGYYRTVN